MGDSSKTTTKVAVLPPDDDAALVPLRYRHDGWTAAKQRAFLQALGETGCVRDACRAAGRSSTSAYRLRARSPEFAAAWDTALEMAATVLEQVAFKRAVIGVEEPVWFYGKQVGTRTRYSDAMLRLLLLRGRMGDASVADDWHAGRSWRIGREMTQEEAKAEVIRRIERLAEHRDDYPD